MAVCDVLDTVLTVAGMRWGGSGQFVVVFSSLTLWIGLLRTCVLQRRQSALQVRGCCPAVTRCLRQCVQWLAILAICAALAVNGVAEVKVVEGNNLPISAVVVLGPELGCVDAGGCCGHATGCSG